MVQTVAGYLAAAPKDKRVALTKLRRSIKAAAPWATESISYGIVAFKHRGKVLVHYAYWKQHLALYGSFGAYAGQLKSYDLGEKGTLRFTVDYPLPDRLVTRMVKDRVAEIDRAG